MGGGLELFGEDIDQQHRGAALQQGGGHAFPDAPRGAGHDRDMPTHGVAMGVAGDGLCVGGGHWTGPMYSRLPRYISYVLRTPLGSPMNSTGVPSGSLTKNIR